MGPRLKLELAGWLMTPPKPAAAPAGGSETTEKRSKSWQVLELEFGCKRPPFPPPCVSNMFLLRFPDVIDPNPEDCEEHRDGGCCCCCSCIDWNRLVFLPERLVAPNRVLAGAQ